MLLTLLSLVVTAIVVAEEGEILPLADIALKFDEVAAELGVPGVVVVDLGISLVAKV